VADVFKAGRRRLDVDLIVRLVRALGLSEEQVAKWRDACLNAHSATKQAESTEALRQLPPELSTFVGRKDELDALIEEATVPSRPGTRVAVVTIEGMAGIGKSQLAIKAAHELVRQGRYQDVQFYANLRGFDAKRPPLDPAEILDSFLRRLGVPGSRIPPDIDGRAAIYRDKLHDREAIILLDNAADEEQILNLIPASAKSLVIITSRRSLAGLEDTTPIRLGVLSSDESLSLLRQIAGPTAINEDLVAARRVIDFCGRLPIAMSLAAQRLRARNAWTVRDLADYLQSHGLNGMAAGRQTVRAVFDLSYRELGPLLQQMYRFLALHPGDSITSSSAAALANVEPNQAQLALEGLLDEHLLQQRSADSYEFHDLIRAHAADLATTHNAEPERNSAITRLLDHYVYMSRLVVMILYPYEQNNHPPVERSSNTSAIESLAESDARSWLNIERSNLVSAIQMAAVHGWPKHAIHLAQTLAGSLLAGAHFAMSETAHKYALAGAQTQGDHADEAQALTDLGVTYVWMSRHREAANCLEHALKLFREVGDQIGEGTVLNNIGLSFDMSSRPLDGIKYYKEALKLFQNAGYSAGQGRILGNLGFAYERLGQHSDSLGHHHQSLAMFRKINHRRGEGRALVNIGRCYAWSHDFVSANRLLEQAITLSQEVGDITGEGFAFKALGFSSERNRDYSGAIDCYSQALDIFQSTGNRADEGRTLSGVGRCLLQMRRASEASDTLWNALEISDELGDRILKSDVLNSLGRLAHMSEHLSQALEYFGSALELAGATGDRYEQARAHEGSGLVHYALGDIDTARTQLRKSIALFSVLNLPESTELEGILRQLLD
jgi:tetratricopeptide (TPR) repeat protein